VPREDGDKELQILGAFAHGLAEAGQFERAVTVQREVVDIHRAAGGPGGCPSPDGVVWSLLDLAIYLDLAGQTDASLEIERNALQFKRRMAAADPRRLPGLAIWLAGVSLRFADTGRRQEAASSWTKPSPPATCFRPKATVGTPDSIRPSRPRCSPGLGPGTSASAAVGRPRSASVQIPGPSSRYSG
jgi:hypothetical protein